MCTYTEGLQYDTLVEKDPKIPKQNNLRKDNEADKEKVKISKANKKAYCELVLVSYAEDRPA